MTYDEHTEAINDSREFAHYLQVEAERASGSEFPVPIIISKEQATKMGQCFDKLREIIMHLSMIAARV